MDIKIRNKFIEIKNCISDWFVIFVIFEIKNCISDWFVIFVTKFHLSILNGFRVTEQTRQECKFC